MHDHTAEHAAAHDHAPVPTKGRRRRRTAVAAAATAALLTAGIGVAYAQTDPAAPSVTLKPAQTDPAPGPRPAPGEWRRHPGGPGPGGPGGKGAFFVERFGGPGIHSESTFKDPDGEGYRTMATQMGEVVNVSQGSLEVKSEDGFTRTYKLVEGSMVEAGRDGIANVEKGDQVHVMAVVEDGTATAKRVADITKSEKEAPKKPR